MLKQKEWIDIIVAKTNCSKKEAKVFYDAVFSGIKEGLVANETIKIAGLGIFKLRKTAAKEQINLVTGKAEIVPEHNVITFKPYFEIDPKPEAIEIESDVTEAVSVDTPVLDNEEVVDEVSDEEVEATEEETTTEEEDVEESVTEEEAVEEENKTEEPVEEKVEEEVKSPLDEVMDNDLVWVYNNQNCTTENVIHLLKQETDLDEADIASAIKVVVDKMHAANKTTCKIKEEKDRFDFVIIK